MLDLLSLIRDSLLIALALFGLGRMVMDLLGFRREIRSGKIDGLETVVFSLGIGTVLVWTGIGLWGIVGGYSTVLFAWLTAAAAVYGAARAICDWSDAVDRRQYREVAGQARSLSKLDPSGDRYDALYLLISVGAAIAVVASFLAAAAPPVAGDALCYHLALPKMFLAAGGLEYLPDHDCSTFPLLSEMGYLWALALRDGRLAQVVHWELGLLTAAATIVMARHVVGRRAALAAGGLLLLVPGVNNQMSVALNDVALAAMLTVALAAWWRAVVDGRTWRWLIVAGIMFGGAIAVKLSAVLAVVAIGPVWMFLLWRRSARPENAEMVEIITDAERETLIDSQKDEPAGKQMTIRRIGFTIGRFAVGSLSVGLIALLIASPWYARSAYYRGNPVYPFFSDTFAEVWQPRGAPPPRDDAMPDSKSRLGRDSLALLAAPWNVFMQPERLGGRGHRLGILPLALIPCLIWMRRRRGVGILVAIAAFWGLGWFFLRQNVRFLLPIAPVLMIPTGYAIGELKRFAPWLRTVARLTVCFAIMLMIATAVYRTRDRLPVVFGAESTEHFLSLQDPTYRAAEFLNQHVATDSRLLSCDLRLYRFDCPVARENVFHRRTAYDQIDDRPISEILRKYGFTHVLLVEVLKNGPPQDTTLAERIDREMSQTDPSEMTTVLDYEHKAVDGAVRRYRLIELQE